MNKGYWEKYYRGLLIPEPSDFAVFCLEHIKATEGGLVEIGCGNGRDSFYFAKHGIKTVAVDQSRIAIGVARAINPYHQILGFTENDISERTFGLITPALHCLYLRFVLHALGKKEQEKLYKLLETSVSHGPRSIFIETRSDKDQLTYSDDHERRFTNKDELIEVMENRLGFQTLFCQEGRGFAKTENEDPIVIRYIGER